MKRNLSCHLGIWPALLALATRTMWTNTLSFLSLYWVVLFDSQQQLRFFHISERLNLLLHMVIVAIWSKKKSSVFLILLFSLHVSWNPFFSLICRVCSPFIGIVEVGFVKLLKHSPSFLTDSTRSYSIVFASKSPFLQNVAMLYKLVLAYRTDTNNKHKHSP